MRFIPTLAGLAMFLTAAPFANATGPYTAYVTRIQATDVGNAYNTVFLDLDIAISPCTSTNDYDRYTITSDTQYATILAAFLTGRQIRVTGTGACNSANIEEISNVQIL